MTDKNQISNFQKMKHRFGNKIWKKDWGKRFGKRFGKKNRHEALRSLAYGDPSSPSVFVLSCCASNKVP